VGFAVDPKRDCPHIVHVSNAALHVTVGGLDPHAACSFCRDKHENWLCLTCFQVRLNPQGYCNTLCILPYIVQYNISCDDNWPFIFSRFMILQSQMQVFCSRYVNSHMIAHNGESHHPITFSWSDRSIWCYACDSYISSPLLEPLLEAATQAKFEWMLREATA
jgi:uncharacterized UBP type Zn finger protein